MDQNSSINDMSGSRLDDWGFNPSKGRIFLFAIAFVTNMISAQSVK
jgi:hypothetical protein